MPIITLATGGGYGAYATSGINFYGIDLATGESTRLFNWVNCDANGDDVNNLIIRDDGSIVCVISSTTRPTRSTLSPSPRSALCLMTPFRIRRPSPSPRSISTGTCAAVIDFNRKNERYRIEVEDYSQYNTDEDYSAGLTKLTTELLAGNVPDIIDLNGLPYTQLAAKGLLEDLLSLYRR